MIWLSQVVKLPIQMKNNILSNKVLFPTGHHNLTFISVKIQVISSWSFHYCIYIFLSIY